MAEAVKQQQQQQQQQQQKQQQQQQQQPESKFARILAPVSSLFPTKTSSSGTGGEALMPEKTLPQTFKQVFRPLIYSGDKPTSSELTYLLDPICSENPWSSQPDLAPIGELQASSMSSAQATALQVASGRSPPPSRMLIPKNSFKEGSRNSLTGGSRNSVAGTSQKASLELFSYLDRR